jgi:hypothetical protein
MVKLQCAKSFASFLGNYCSLQLLCFFYQFKKVSLFNSLITFKLFNYLFPLFVFLKFSSPLIPSDLSIIPIYQLGHFIIKNFF